MVKAPWRNVSSDKYIVAGIITFLIFTLGLLLGIVIEDHRYNLVEEINQEQEVKSLSLQMQYLFLTSTNSYNNCPILSTTLRAAISDLSDSLGQVISYEEENEASQSRRISVQRRYALDNIRYWLLATESKKRCNLNIAPVLYFYTHECSSCPNQGTILTHHKNIFSDKLLVFPINLDLRDQESMVEIMMSQFNITRFPTLVVDNKKFEGVVKSDQLFTLVCDSLENVPQECK